ncbi:MAG: protein kinase, partial [Planctomycetota bacterium]|nr:protein kinase [Planctomycetota bacterium]
MSISSRKLRELVGAFRDARRSPDDPGLENFLAQHESLWAGDVEARRGLLRELLTEELHKRYADGMKWDRGAYDARFPDDGKLLDELFDAEPNKTSPPDPNAPTSMVLPLIKGTRIGPYKLLKRLGAGGMGQVWMANCEASGHWLTGKDVAIKVLHSDFHSSESYELIQNELRGIANLEHPNIVKLLDTRFPDAPSSGDGQADSDLAPMYLVFELIAGEKTLESVIAGHRLEPKPLCQIISRLAGAVAHSHARQPPIYHHDIKPANVLIDDDGSPKLTDFGLAHRLGEAEKYPGGGTTLYMSPERLRGKEHLYGGPDVWSLGVILYELLTGQKPFPTRDAILDQNFRYRPIKEINGSALSEMVDLCRRCLDRDIDQRITAGDLASELEQISAEPTSIRSAHVASGPAPQADQSTRLVSNDETQVFPERRNLPHASLGELFIGREQFLEDLRRRLLSDDQTILVIAAPQPIYGLGGLGKTQLVVEYAWRFGMHYSALLFVTADTPATLQQDLAKLCGVLKIEAEAWRDEEAKAQEALAWLRKNRNWLLIVDNVDDEDCAEQVEKTLANLTPNGHILITSRLSNWQGAVEPLELDVLAQEDAGDLLEAWTSKRKRQDDDREQSLLLARELDGLALAVRQAASVINRLQTSFAKYRERWKQQDGKVVKWHNQRDMKYPRSLATTWQVTIDRMSEPARRLLDALAWLAPDPIPDWLFTTDVERYEDSLAELATYSMTTRGRSAGTDDSESFRIHRVVQDITRFRIPADQRADRIGQALSLWNAAELGDPTNFHSWKRWDLARPHVATVLEHCSEAGITADATRMMNQLGLLLAEKCVFTQAEALYRRALAIDEQSYGAEHPNVAIDL